MSAWTRSAWLNVVAAVLGGVLFGSGLIRMYRQISIASTAWTVVGLLLLWWALSDRGRSRPESPQSETDGSRTIE